VNEHGRLLTGGIDHPPALPRWRAERGGSLDTRRIDA
jgi:hypothetical protein